MAQKVVQYQAVMQMAEKAPQLYDLPYLHRQMLEVLGIKNAVKLVPMDDDQKPRDPVSENMSILNGKPVKAFIYQDHEAHIAVHQSAMQDPKMAQIMGQNPQAQSIMAAANAHIMEHLAFAYRKHIEEQAGVPYPEPDSEMDENMEADISRLAAAAAQNLLQKNQMEAQQQQAQQTAQDPIVQMQQQELQLKQQELQLKAQEQQLKMQEAQQELGLKEKQLMIDAATKKDQLDIERQRIEVQERIAGMQVGAKTAAERARYDLDMLKTQADYQEKGLRTGMDIQKSKTDQEERGMRAGMDLAKSHADEQHRVREHNLKSRQTLTLNRTKKEDKKE
jgi:hypothetical protein